MRKHVIWILAACLLLTGCGQQPEVAVEEKESEAAVEQQKPELSDAPKQTVLKLDTGYDFTHDGAAEELELVTVLDPDTGEDLWYELQVRNSGGRRIWSYELPAGGPAWDTALFSVEAEGQDCLLELITAMGQGYCSYRYEVFALSETGERVTAEQGEVQFDVNFASPIHESFDCAAIADFLWRVQALTAEAGAILMDVDVTDGLRCLVSPKVFEHTYHCGQYMDAESREELESRIAYGSFLNGNLALVAPEDLDTWGLRDWRDMILAYSEMEYLHLDLDGDGGKELLVQWVEAPENYNGVFHYEAGSLTCWQNDLSEGSCRDYPLWDGTMVRQYDLEDATVYTLFRYRSDGEIREQLRLVAREAVVDPESGEEGEPTYEVNGMDVDEATFEEWLYDRVSSRLADPSDWTEF